MKKGLLILGTIVLLTGCITNKSLLKAYPEKDLKSIDNINGKYENIGLNDRAQLFRILNECLDIEKSDSVFYKNILNTVVQLNYDGGKRLDVSLLQGDFLYKRIELKVKNKGHYLSVKRHLFLVPIPFLFYVHKERKTILFIDATGNLVTVNGNDQFIWVLMAGGNRQDTVSKHTRKYM